MITGLSAPMVIGIETREDVQSRTLRLIPKASARRCIRAPSDSGKSASCRRNLKRNAKLCKILPIISEKPINQMLINARGPDSPNQFRPILSLAVFQILFVSFGFKAGVGSTGEGRFADSAMIARRALV